MTMTSEELARRFEEADRRVVLLRRATLDMQVVRELILSEHRRGPERSRRDGAVRR